MPKLLIILMYFFQPFKLHIWIFKNITKSNKNNVLNH